MVVPEPIDWAGGVDGDLVIRDACADDLAPVLRLLAQLHLPDAPPSGLPVERVFLSILGRDDHTFLVAQEEGGLAGAVHLVVVPNLTHDGRPWAIVENLVVDEPARRRGIGRALMEEVVRRARDQGCYKLQLLSGAGRADAHMLYESLGFEATARGYRLYF